MIVLHVVEPFAAGIAVFVRSLTESMPDDLHIVVHGERKQVMTAADVKRSFPQKNVRFIKWHSAQRSIHPLKDFQALSELYRIIRRLKKKNLIDVVHLHSSKSGLLGRMACRMAGVTNVVYTPNGAPFLSSNSIINYIYRQLEKLGHRLGGKVICCSESELEEYQKIGIEGAYINNGVSLKQNSFYQKKDTGKFRVITSGRILAQKNPVLFNTIAGYFEEFEEYEFIWAGDGEDKHLLTAKNIKVTGWLNREQVREEMVQSDIYLSTSLYEGLSFAVLEALALKKPVLLSECVGNKDVIRSGLNGDFFRNEMEAITKILTYSNNRDMLSIMGEYSKELCEIKFDMTQNFQLYKDIYQENLVKL
jgi:glycosyltransferase involved in cell wall biosynthesis